MHQTNINRNTYALTFWIVLPSIAMVLGILWQQYVHSMMDVYASYALESLVLILLILLVSRIFFRNISSEYTGGVLFRIGLIWATLFFAFNLLNGLFFLALPLDGILADYDTFAGRFGFVVLLVVFLCPRNFFSLSHVHPAVDRFLKYIRRTGAGICRILVWCPHDCIVATDRNRIAEVVS